MIEIKLQTHKRHPIAHPWRKLCLWNDIQLYFPNSKTLTYLTKTLTQNTKNEEKKEMSHGCWSKGPCYVSSSLWWDLRNLASSCQAQIMLSLIYNAWIPLLNTWKLRQNGRHSADDIFKCIFLNENCCILIEISLKFVLKGPIENKPSLVQIMACRRTGDKPLSGPMMD